MSAKKPNISQINKYLQGKLDTRAMHQLERQAQDDPFLTDALEGYEKAGKNQRANLADLKEQLAKRTAPAKQRSLVLWRALPIAATVLLMLGAGYWFFKPEPTKKQYVVKVTGDNLLTPPPAVEKQIIGDSKDSKHTDKETYKTDRTEYIADNRNVRANATADDILKKMDGVGVSPDGNITYRGQAVAGAKLNGKDFAGGNLANAIQNLPADIVENLQIVDDYGNQSNRAGVKDGEPKKVLNITTDTSKRDMIAVNRAPRMLNEIAISGLGKQGNERTVTGKVLDQQGEPLAGARVTAEGTDKGVQTDTNGNFKIELPANKDLLAVNSIGFSSKRVNVGNQDNVNISMEASKITLNEVAVTGYGTKNNPPVILRDESIISGPMPVYKNGTIEYIGDDYLFKPNAGVDQLLNKMRGFDVDPIGIAFQGQYIIKAKLNGKYIGEDNLYNAIKRIPASNIEKVVMVPEKNGLTVKPGNQPTQPEYILNLITYTNKKAFMAAKRTIRGKVTDKQGAALIGVSVSVAETEGKRVFTDANGNFKIDMPTRKNALLVYYVGHNYEHVKVGKQNNLHIKIEPYKYRYASTEPGKSPINCNENLKFKTAYFYNVHIVQQYGWERGSSKPTISIANFQKALSYLNKYNKVAIDKFLADSNSINSSNISNYTSQCLKWYEDNKCNNLK